MNIEKIRSIIEALIFSSEEPVSLDSLSRAVEEIEKQEVQAIVESLITEWRSLGRSFHIVEVAGGWQFRTKAEYGPWLQRAHHDRPTKLSRASLETLSVIAYKQPITRPEIEDLRGVDSGAVLKNLLERQLIKIVGKKDAPGKPVVYGTTQRFLEVFSLRDLGSLPSLRDMSELDDDAGQLSFDEVEAAGGDIAEIIAREPEKITDTERRKRIRDSVRGLLSSQEDGAEELPPPPDEEDDDALLELEQALAKRREAADRADAIFDESERDYIEKVTNPEISDEVTTEAGTEVSTEPSEATSIEPSTEEADPGTEPVAQPESDVEPVAEAASDDAAEGEPDADLDPEST